MNYRELANIAVQLIGAAAFGILCGLFVKVVVLSVIELFK